MKIKKIQKKYIFIAIIIIIVVGSWSIYKSDRARDFAIDNHLPGARTIYNELGKIEQQLNPFVAFKYNLRKLRKSDIPAFYIRLSGNDLRFFHEVQEKVRKGANFIDPNLKTWRNAELSYNGKKYDIKIRIRGIYKPHAENYKKSYKVKILNNENINGLSTFNFILPEDRSFYFAALADYLADELQTPAVDSSFANLFFNGRIQGIYLFTEDANKDFLEHHGLQSSSLFNTNDDLFFSQTPHQGRSELQAYDNKQGDSYSLKPEDTQHFSEFLQALKEENLPLIYEKIDIDRVAKFAAITTLFHDSHMITINTKYYLDGTTGKIAPIIWDIHLYNFMNSTSGFDAQFLNSRGNLSEIVSLFLLNPQFLQLRNKYLYQLVNDDLVMDYVNKAADQFDSLFMMDTNSIYSYRRTKRLLDGYKEAIQNNVSFLRNIFRFNDIYATSHYGADYVDIDISTYNISQAQLNAIKFENVSKIKSNSKLIINHIDGKQDFIPINQSGPSFVIPINNALAYPYLDESFALRNQKLRLSITGIEFDETLLENIKLEMTNDISGTQISQEEIRYKITNYYTNATLLDEENLIKNGIRYSLKDNHLIIYPGTYVLKETYRIPNHVTIQGGTTLLLSPDVSLVFGDSLYIKGTAASPVIIRNQVSGQPFGSIAVIGQSDSIVDISFLNIFGGREDYVDGAYFSGAFSIHHADKTTIKNSTFYNNQADDGLNIKYSQVLLKDNIFKNNYVDQVDLDFCNGIVSNNQFVSPVVKNDNGDGLDISGSSILTESNLFDGFGDKGISIGEKSEIYVIDSVIRNNTLGAAVKDSSTAYFYNNEWVNNDTDISAYQKKAIFDSGTVIKLDDKSQIEYDKF